MEKEKTHSIIKKSISYVLNEMADPNAKIWNVFKIPANIGVNGYSISSKFDERTVLSAIISISKHKWKTGETITVEEDEDGSGYMFRYIITLIKKEIKENYNILKSPTRFTKEISKYFGPVTKINEEMLDRATAEDIKRKIALSDLDSFKRKGASVVEKEIPISGKSGKKLLKVKGLKDSVDEMLYTEDIQYFSEDGTIFYSQTAFEKLLELIPSSFVDELISINKDKNNKKDPLTGRTIPHKLRNMPKGTKIYTMLKSLIDTLI